MNYFAKNLDYLKRSLKVRQNRLAKYMGVAPTTVANWMTKKSEPNIEELVKIVQYFGLSVEKMLYTDMEKTEFITEDDVREFKARGKLPVLHYQADEDSDSRQSIVSEPEPLRDWALMKLMKGMDEKLDQLLEADKRMQQLKP